MDCPEQALQSSDTIRLRQIYMSMSICARRIVDAISSITLHAQRRLAADQDPLGQYFKFKSEVLSDKVAVR